MVSSGANGSVSLLDTLLAFSAFKEDGEPIRDRLCLDAKMVEISNLAVLDHSFLHSVRLQLAKACQLWSEISPSNQIRLNEMNDILSISAEAGSPKVVSVLIQELGVYSPRQIAALSKNRGVHDHEDDRKVVAQRL